MGNEKEKVKSSQQGSIEFTDFQRNWNLNRIEFGADIQTNFHFIWTVTKLIQTVLLLLELLHYCLILFEWVHTALGFFSDPLNPILVLSVFYPFSTGSVVVPSYFFPEFFITFFFKWMDTFQEMFLDLSSQGNGKKPLVSKQIQKAVAVVVKYNLRQLQSDSLHLTLAVYNLYAPSKLVI